MKIDWSVVKRIIELLPTIFWFQYKTVTIVVIRMPIFPQLFTLQLECSVFCSGFRILSRITDIRQTRILLHSCSMKCTVCTAHHYVIQGEELKTKGQGCPCRKFVHMEILAFRCFVYQRPCYWVSTIHLCQIYSSTYYQD